MPPYLHYQDVAEEEESCPQPSALPAALAASLPAMHEPPAASQPRFHSHPPLPPHPLLKLHRSAVSSPVQQGLCPGYVGDSPAQRGPSPGPAAISSGHGDISPMAELSTMLRYAGPSAKGTGASSSPKQPSTQAHCSGNSHAALGDACAPPASEPEGREAIEQLQHRHLQPAEARKQPFALMTLQGADSDDGRLGLGPVAAPHGSRQEGPDGEEQAHSDSCSERESAGAVGDDELLDHDLDFAHYDTAVDENPGDQNWHSVQFPADAQHGSASHHPPDTEQLCAVGSCQGEAPTHSGMLNQREEGKQEAKPQHFGVKGFARQHRVAAHPQPWPNQAMCSTTSRVHMHHGVLQTGLQEEHVSREGSKLAAAYRRHSHLEQQHHEQRQAQQQVQHRQVESTGMPEPNF